MGLFPYCEGTNISFKTCLPSTHEQYIKHIESTIPKDTPLAFGLHPNAEIEYRTFASNEMFDTLISLQSSDGSGGEGQLTPTEIAAAKMEECGTRIEDINFDPESKPKELFSYMPIVTCSAILSTEVETNGVFSAPTYKTEFRGPTFIFSAQVRTKHPNAKWVLAGVALVMDVGE